MAFGRRRSAVARYKILYGYVFREFALSFLISFLFFFVVFFVNQLLLMAEDILSKRAPIKDVLLLLVYAIPSEIAMSFPFASLVGALMSAGRLNSDNELLVMQAAGISTRRVFVPFLVLGIIFAGISFTMNDFFLPLGSIEYGKIYRSLIVSSPAVELKPWSSRRYKDFTIVTGDVSGSTVEDILIFDKAEDGNDRVISAKTAQLVEKGGNAVFLELGGVWIQTLSSGADERVEYSSCDRMEYRIELSEQGGSTAVIGPYEMSSLDLGRAIGDKEKAFLKRLDDRQSEIENLREKIETSYETAELSSLSWPNARSLLDANVQRYRELSLSKPSDRSIQVYRLEYNKKFAIPSGAFCFVFLAFPLGLKARRSGRGVGFGLGLLIAVAYWALLLGGQTLGTRLGWSPFWSMWGPNVFVLASAALLWFGNRFSR